MVLKRMIDSQNYDDDDEMLQRVVLKGIIGYSDYSLEIHVMIFK